jgi:hypothetical protein
LRTQTNRLRFKDVKGKSAKKESVKEESVGTGLGERWWKEIFARKQ